jgi:hypothetical protein
LTSEGEATEMIRIIVEIEPLDDTPDPGDEAQVTLLREHLVQVAEQVLTERFGVLEDYDGAPCGSFRVETVG